MTITTSQLRQNIYRLLDSVVETGNPLEIRRKGATIRISAEKPRSKLSRLKKRKILRCPPEKIIHMDWSKEWRP